MADNNSSTGDLLSNVVPGLGLLQTGIGIVQDIQAKKKIDSLLSQRKAYQTPQEVYDILNATQANASQGYDATTLDYLTNQTDQAFSSALGTAQRLGADPNDLSAIFGQKVNEIMKIGAENHNLNMQNFSTYLNALNSVATNKAAEQKSQQDILKDRLQAAGLQAQTGTANISGGLNTLLSAFSAEETAKLYGVKKGDKTTQPTSDVVSNNGSGTYLTNRIPMQY